MSATSSNRRPSPVKLQSTAVNTVVPQNTSLSYQTPLSSALSNARLTGLVNSNTQFVPLNTQSPAQSSLQSSLQSSAQSIQDRLSPRKSTKQSVKQSAKQSVRQNTKHSNEGEQIDELRSLTVNPERENMYTSELQGVTPYSELPEEDNAEIMNSQFVIKDYQGVISNASLENELINSGYAPISRIVVASDNGDKRTQYIKAINKNGQKVFVQLDVSGYTSARSTDLTFVESNKATIVPYSIKTGAMNCVGNNTCGVAFECGNDAVCVLSRGADDKNDMQPKEANYVYVEKHAPSSMVIESEGSTIAYPVVRLSEIRANPDLVLENTNIATRRLRNSSYEALLSDLSNTQKSIVKLWQEFSHFDQARYNNATKLNASLTQLELYNDKYNEILNSSENKQIVLTDEEKDRYRLIQHNLMIRNDSIVSLLKAMKKVADKHSEMERITKEIRDITEFLNRELVNVDLAIQD